MKKLVILMLVGVLALAAFAGCGNNSETSFDSTQDIAVISREEGSGTRGAFIELVGIEQKNAEGKKIDYTTDEAIINNGTAVVLTTVAGNPYSIGYISLGSLNNTVKALKVDGVEATADNIKAGTYAVARPFNIATKGAPGALAQDFIDYIMSDDGQAIAEDEGYIAVSSGSFTTAQMAGKLVIGGSSSVTPLMEKLVEAYNVINPNAEIEVQLSDSTTGMTNTMSGTFDIGMASRDLKDSEKAELTNIVIAKDGIAVIVNLDNTTEDVTAEQIRQIYVGETLTWDEL